MDDLIVFGKTGHSDIVVKEIQQSLLVFGNTTKNHFIIVKGILWSIMNDSKIYCTAIKHYRILVNEIFTTTL